MTQLAPTGRVDGPSPSTSAVLARLSASGMLRLVALGAAQALITGGSLYLFLGGWRRDWRVPLHFSVDSLIALMQSKSTFDNGWWWFNPMLGAPFGLDSVAFPMNGNVDQAIVWFTSWFVGDAVATTNIAWLVMVVLSGLSASWCIRQCGASRISSVVAGTLFALSPYALYRHIGHIWMVTYLVPFASTAALLLYTGRFRETVVGRSTRGLLLAGCVLLGLNYVYYAFFGCFFVLVAALARAAASRDWRMLRAGTICVGLIAGATLLNLTPTLVSWSRHERPLILHEKVPAESEMYGLKIRHLVSPAYQHAFPPFGWWQQKEAQARFPLETENQGSRLGFIATLGFLGLLCLLFVPQAVERSVHRETLLGASRLMLAAVLLATIGGFGSLFSLLISSEIRAWNRITPFIAFFSLTAVSLGLDALSMRRALQTAVALTVLAVGLADQRMAAMPLNAEYPQLAPEMPVLRRVVGQLENRLPDRSMVLQLPFRTYLYDYGVARMKPYEHVKPYLASHTLRWSYPALSNAQVRWQYTAGRLDPGQLATEAAAEGFGAILVDRFGYTDNGAAVTAAISGRLSGDHVLADEGRYIALDIRALRGTATKSAILSSVLGPATLGMRTCPGEPLIGFDRIGEPRAPSDGILHVSGSDPLKVAGWAVDQQKGLPAWAVDIVLDDTPFPSVYGSDRADVAEHFKVPAYQPSGFAAEIPVEDLRTGQHTLTVRVVSADRQCFYEGARMRIRIE